MRGRELDGAVPPGTKTCIYEVTAMRSTHRGMSARYTIQSGNASPMPSQVVGPRGLAA